MVVTGIIGLVLSLVVPLYLHVQRAGERMEAQARAVVAARETAAQLRRDIQAAERVTVTSQGLLLLVSESGGVGEVAYARNGSGWVRRAGSGAAGAGSPLWLREEVRSLTFTREGSGVRAAIVADPQLRGTHPVTVDFFAAPRNGGTH
jgi:type II secretory pathway pseudopilin PulG